MKIQLTDVWENETHEHAVEITTEHPASSYGQPVIVFDDGKCCGADTWILGCGRVIEATAAEREMFEKWYNNIMLFSGLARAE